MKLGIIGGGRAAWAFGSAWKSIGRPLAGFATRSSTGLAGLLQVDRLALPDLVRVSDIVLVAVTDTALRQVGAQLAPILGNRPVFHPSGSLSSDVFAPHSLAFSLHPLRSLPRPGDPCDFANTLFTFEGSTQTRETARDFVTRVGGRFTEIAKERKPLYHAAAVFASNYVAALLEIAEETILESGVKEDVRRELASLAQSAITNWLRREFTGPIARGDQSVIEAHYQALAHDPDRAELYRRLAEELAKALQQKSF